MKGYTHKIGLTLLEMLVVVGIIAILVSVTVSIATRIDNQAREQLVANTFALLDTALEQFRDYGYSYDHTNYISPEERNFYRGLDFPIDCNGFSQLGLETELAKVLNKPVVITATGHRPTYSSGEALYFFLSRVPQCRQTLDKIDASLITNLGTDRQPMRITVGAGVSARDYPLIRIVDPWRTVLRYDYYNELALTPLEMELSKRNFPLITSAGPDRRFDTADDITNR